MWFSKFQDRDCMLDASPKEAIWSGKMLCEGHTCRATCAVAVEISELWVQVLGSWLMSWVALSTCRGL